MKKKLLFLVIISVMACIFATAVNAEDYSPAFGEVTILDGISQPTNLDTTSRVLMSDGVTYPAYYILNDSTSFSPNFNKINNIVGSGKYSRATVVALEIPEGIINLPSCYNAGGLFQGDKYDELIEYLRLPSSLETMGEAAIFSLSTLKIIDNLENTKIVEVPSRGFNALTSLRYIHLPNTVKTIPDRAFRDCNSVEYIILGSSIEYIGTQAFLYAGKASATDSLKIYISNSITQIYNAYGDGPLQGCKSVVELYYTGNMEDSGMAQIIASPGILKNASKWPTVDASAEGFDKNAIYTKSTIIYNYNICDAFYGGIHNETDINECQFGCDVCNTVNMKENPQHQNKVTIQKTDAGYFGDIFITTCCSICKNVEKEEKIPAMFTSLGYSASLYGSGNSIVQGFVVNKEAVEAYKAYVPDFSFGVLAAVNHVENEQEASPISPKLNGEKVISYQFDASTNNCFEIKVSGISKEQKDLLIVICAYAKEGDKLYYLDNGKTGDSIMGISLNQVSGLNS